MENVPGIAFASKDEGICFLRQEIEKINAETGCRYTFQPALLRAVDFGIPQDRHRVFIVGHRDGKAFRFPAATHGDIRSRRT